MKLLDHSFFSFNVIVVLMNILLTYSQFDKFHFRIKVDATFIIKIKVFQART